MRCSFVIPTFQSAAWLVHAVKSCQKQTHADIEICVVDDGSTDSTQSVMRFMAEKDARIKYIRLEKNSGRSQARNVGNREASGEVLLVLDADDIAYPERAALTVKALQKSDFVYGSADVIDAIGTKLGTLYADVFNRDRAIKTKLNHIVHSTCGYRKELAARFPYPGDEAARLGLEDWAFQLTVATSGAKLEHIPTVIAAYRDIESGISKRRDPAEVARFKDAFMEGLLTKA